MLYGGNQNNLTTLACTLVECVLRVRGVKSSLLHGLLVPEPSSQRLSQSGIMKGFHIWLKSYRKRDSIPIDDQVWHGVCAAQT